MHESRGTRTIISPEVILPEGLEPDFRGYSYDFLRQDFMSIRGSAFIQRYQRFDDAGRLNVPAIAREIPVDISRPRRHLDNPDRAILYGTKEGWGVSFDMNAPDEHIPFIFGHEVGHIVLFSVAESKGDLVLQRFMARCDTDPGYKGRVEAFCEFFSGKLLGWIE